MSDEQETVVETVEVGTIQDMTVSGSVGMLDKAAIDVQVATAKQFPRVLSKCREEALALATYDAETAKSMFYVLPKRGRGKDIQGPSARLAEAVVYAWGNFRVDADVVDIGKKWVTAMGTAFDLERNIASRVRVMRRITDRNGRRFGDDMIGVTSNAAISIAYRNAVLKLIPKAYTDPIYKAAQLASTGQGTLAQKRTRALDFFGERGVKPEQVYELLEVRALDDLELEHIIRLAGIATAIKDGDTSIEQIFSPGKDDEPATQDLNAALEGDTDAEDAAGAASGGGPGPSTPEDE